MRRIEPGPLLARERRMRQSQLVTTGVDVSAVGRLVRNSSRVIGNISSRSSPAGASTFRNFPGAASGVQPRISFRLAREQHGHTLMIHSDLHRHHAGNAVAVAARYVVVLLSGSRRRAGLRRPVLCGGCRCGHSPTIQTPHEVHERDDGRLTGKTRATSRDECVYFVTQTESLRSQIIRKATF